MCNSSEWKKKHSYNNSVQIKKMDILSILEIKNSDIRFEVLQLHICKVALKIARNCYVTCF